MSETISITLAGNTYVIPSLNLGQLRDLSIGISLPDEPDPQESVRRSYDRAVTIIATALRSGNPQLSVEALYKMTITRKEMRDAVDAILTFSGLIAKPSSGEAVAGAT